SGQGAGKVIPISVSPFLIGRNPACHLRPASVMVSGRHCALWVRSGWTAVRDLGSTNGTFLNGERVADERELHDGDRLQVGPLIFDVRLEGVPSVDRPTPAPVETKGASDLEDAAAIILFEDEAVAPAPGPAVDETGVPTGPTAMGLPPPP